MNIKKKDNESARISHQEWLILQVELHIEKLMTKYNVDNKKLAKRLGKSEKYVKKLCDNSNLTLKEISDVFLALDSSLVVDTGGVEFSTTIKPANKTKKESGKI